MKWEMHSDNFDDDDDDDHDDDKNAIDIRSFERECISQVMLEMPAAQLPDALPDRIHMQV